MNKGFGWTVEAEWTAEAEIQLLNGLMKLMLHSLGWKTLCAALVLDIKRSFEVICDVWLGAVLVQDGRPIA